MSSGLLSNQYFHTTPPTFRNGSDFLGYKVPAAQTFTSFSPASDENAYIQATTGLSGTSLRNFLQSKNATEFLNQAVTGKLGNSVSYLGIPAYGSKASCQQDADCASGQVCYAFNEFSFGPQQGPTCSETIYPEILLGNKVNDGKPLRQYSNFCYTDDDCKGIDELTGKPKQGLSCNHYYKGPQMYSKNGLCQLKYENNGRNYYLKTPPGWTFPLQSKLQKCEKQSDCGPTGINGWTRCVAGADDGSKYCVWPGQTSTPSPRDLINDIPQGFNARQPIPVLAGPTGVQAEVLDLQAQQASNSAINQGYGGTLRNTSKPPVKNTNSLIAMSDASHYRNQNEQVVNRTPAIKSKS